MALKKKPGTESSQQGQTEGGPAPMGKRRFPWVRGFPWPGKQVLVPQATNAL